MAVIHLCSNINSLLRDYSAVRLGDIFEMDGEEVIKQLKELQSKGHKLLPSEGCEHFDPFEKGCQCRFNKDWK